MENLCSLHRQVHSGLAVGWEVVLSPLLVRLLAVEIAHTHHLSADLGGFSLDAACFS